MAEIFKLGDIFDLTYIYCGYDGILISNGKISIKPNWFHTKDLHPRYEDLHIIRDFINSIDKKESLEVLLYFTINKDNLTKDHQEILKLKNNENLYKILLKNYINSNKGFEYFLDRILEELQKYKKNTYESKENNNNGSIEKHT